MMQISVAVYVVFWTERDGCCTGKNIPLLSSAGEAPQGTLPSTHHYLDNRSIQDPKRAAALQRCMEILSEVKEGADVS